jgi:DNA-binding GntR family transcriptional regulator
MQRRIATPEPGRAGVTAAKNRDNEKRRANDRVLLKERAYAKLKQRVVTGRYSPGTFLSERMLASELGMSKTPIRAALERLEAEEFVSVSPQQGIVVREPSIREIADQFELRLALEGHVLRSLAGRLDDDQVRRVRDNLRHQCRAAQDGDLATTIKLDSEFHLTFCELLGNREILRILGQLREKIEWVIALVFRDNIERMWPNWEEHQGIAEAVIEGNADLGLKRLEAHLEYGKRALLSRS